MFSAAVEASFFDKQFKQILILFWILEFLRNELLYSNFPCFWKDYSNKYLWWGFSCLYSLMYPFPSPFFLLTLLSSSSLTQTNSLLKGSRRRQKGSDYTSTSDDDEYDSKQSTPKNKRSQPSSAFHSPRSQPRHRPQPMVALHPKHSGKDSEESKPEGETLPNWSNHSAEIAR